ncbi:MAG: helix-turn-helix transcriptional regulator [Jiangellaceae bacterium]|nr:helix-turn-helix transcriptional regulator [Jiangellaceae bacterium]
MPPSNPPPALESFGIGARGDRVYRTVLREGPIGIGALAQRLDWDEAELQRELEPIVELGLIAVSDGDVIALSPHLALGRLAEQEARNLAARQQALVTLRTAIPDYAAEERDLELTGSRLQPVELHTGPEIRGVVDALLRSTAGELLMVHPVEWLVDPGLNKGDTSLPREIFGGRPARSIYPAEAMHRPEWLRVVREWADVGEQVRLLPSPPSRLMLFGTEAALVPVEWGRYPARRVVVRTPGVVDALSNLFELLWRQAVPFPGTADGSGGNKQVLRLLAAGAKDETIARQLGLSLRTVRRRVADVLGELGATTRFQAGVEAARRKLV